MGARTDSGRLAREMLAAAGASGGAATTTPSDARPRIKLCGMFRDADIDAVNDSRPDLCGFVVSFPRSHRNVSPERLGRLVGALDEAIGAVGVFVDQPEGFVAQVANEVVDVVQLHGSEDNAYIGRLRALTDAPIVQAVRMRSARDACRAARSAADLVLLDSGWGTGRRFDWALVAGVARPFMLAGGLCADNVAEAVRACAPWGVDMSSGLETDGLKDPARIRAAVRAARGAR